MMKRLSALLPAICLLGLLTTVPAEGASPTDCFGKTPTTVGTSGNDVIYAGYENNVIYAGKGNDVIRVDEDTDSDIWVCAGPGKDKIHSGPFVKVHGGDGYDTAVIPACGTIRVFAVEDVTVVQPTPYDGSSSNNCGHA